MVYETYRHVLMTAETIKDPRLLIGKEGALEARYAPFDHVTTTARLIILGITPGEQQANAAIREAGQVLRAGGSNEEVLARAKAHASFAGAMRTNLIAMLDSLSINRKLGIDSCESLWDSHLDLVQFASALRYPIFSHGKNYSGSSPKITSSPFLRGQLLAYTAREFKALPRALVLPLGPAVTEACQYLAASNLLDRARVIEGIPHPSGANAERIAYFLGRKEKHKLSAKTNADKIDHGRKLAEQTVKEWDASS